MKLSSFFQATLLLLSTCHLGYGDLGQSPSFNSSEEMNETQLCRMPSLEVYSEDVQKYLKHQGRIMCRAPRDWVKIKGSRAYITREAKAKFGAIKCAFTDIYRRGEFNTTKGKTSYSTKGYSLKMSDFVFVQCTSKGRFWRSALAGIRRDENVFKRTGWKNETTSGLHMNVLIFALDSMSRLSFIRKLPKTYDYVTKKLNATVIEGYNVVGSATKSNVIPLLTGKKRSELPVTSSVLGNKAYHPDVYPFIWKNFEKEGYVTAFMEYTLTYGLFTYGMKGFLRPPTDHYMRTFYVASRPLATRDYCIGSIPRHKIMMDYATNLFRVYQGKPKFIFGIHDELSHNYVNLIQGADDDLLRWIQVLKTEGHLESTIFILMSDHGLRFTDFHNTPQGMTEERLPWVSFILPPSFEKSFPEAAANLKKNRNRLTTPFDIHSTLLDVLHFQAAEKRNSKERSISLFNEIPENRTCYDASIRPYWCACSNWEEMDAKDPIVIRAGERLVDHINEYVSNSTRDCQALTLSEVLWAKRLASDQSLKESDEVSYQFKIKTQPGSTLYVAFFEYDVKTEAISGFMSEIALVSSKAHQAACFSDKYGFGKFCFCKVVA